MVAAKMSKKEGQTRKAWQDAYNKARRERCAQLGICVSCNQPCPDTQRCKACSDKRREYHKAYMKGYTAGLRRTRKVVDLLQEVLAVAVADPKLLNELVA